MTPRLHALSIKRSLQYPGLWLSPIVRMLRRGVVAVLALFQLDHLLGTRDRPMLRSDAVSFIWTIFLLVGTAIVYYLHGSTLPGAHNPLLWVVVAFGWPLIVSMAATVCCALYALIARLSVVLTNPMQLLWELCRYRTPTLLNMRNQVVSLLDTGNTLLTQSRSLEESRSMLAVLSTLKTSMEEVQQSLAELCASFPPSVDETMEAAALISVAVRSPEQQVETKMILDTCASCYAAIGSARLMLDQINAELPNLGHRLFEANCTQLIKADSDLTQALDEARQKQYIALGIADEQLAQ